MEKNIARSLYFIHTKYICGHHSIGTLDQVDDTTIGRMLIFDFDQSKIRLQTHCQSYEEKG